MKKWIFLLPCTVFPYSLLVGLLCFLKGLGNVGEVFGFLPYLFLLSLACSIAFLILSILRKWDSEKISFCNMMVKIVQIPAYGLIFVLGLLSFSTLFTMGLSVFLLLFDLLSILLTGLIGVAGTVRCYAEGKISRRFAIWIGLLQFVFCADVISAVVLFARAKSGSRRAGRRESS
ncbi:hypothetical protein KQI82_09085 [Oscillibacter sp. MSJ-2]|uniref:Uncharacterized protein n=1 Tax=Dysosmobacter acutus TaxID=2841504 RepID=A0ABS6F9V0_9FIRM|nr:hypothetical protein [Dysosmobacter acutus]MBU5627059.1 hypothetical protein [Dysosmobacter acutus]